jgi:hypothetical protein
MHSIKEEISLINSGFCSGKVKIEDEDFAYLGDGENVDLIDLEATDGILYNDGDSMMEIKYPERDIRVRIKEK